jgi:cytochrome c oxidase cbb3-type subunit 3
VFRVEPPLADTVERVATTDFHAGAAQSTTTQPATTQPMTHLGVPPAPAGIAPASQPVAEDIKNPYEQNAEAISEGKNLFAAFNCVGCHFHGGGGIGPPLMDDKWIYGSEPAQIFATIVEGRPNGMPSFRGKIVDYQVWEIAAYVRSMSGNASPQATSGRSDHMYAGRAENSRSREFPVQTYTP